MRELPTFVYAMVPGEPAALTNFFETGPVQELLGKPGELRHAGWDLNTGERARIVKGEYLEVKSAERKTIRLYEDGSLIAKVAADQDFLGWGIARNDAEFKDRPRLNSLALTEFSYNFVNLGCKLVKLLQPLPSTVTLRVEIRNAIFDDSTLYVVPYGVGTDGWLFDIEQYKAPEKNMLKEIVVSAEELSSRPEAIAYSLVEKIYTWFGVPAERIPYTSNDDTKKFIDTQKIINSRR